MTHHLQAGGDTGNNQEGGTLIFVSDASAEAERLMNTLRARGYPVVDVPLSLLVSRVSVQHPALILCDADAIAALDTIARVRELPGGQRIDVLFLGEPGRTVDAHAGSLEQQASGVFVRPVDDLILLRRVETLLGAPSGQGGSTARATTTNRTPVLVAATRRPYRYDAGKDEQRSENASGLASAQNPEIGQESRSRSSSPPASVHSHASRAYDLPQARLSPALESLLATAEQRVRSMRHSSAPPSDRLSPEAELEAILPADILDALDEPLDFDDDDDESDSASGMHNAPDGEYGTRATTKTTGAGSIANTGSGSGSGSSLAVAPASTPDQARPTVAPSNALAASGSPESQPRGTEPPATPPQHRPRFTESELPAGTKADQRSDGHANFAGTIPHGPSSELPSSVPTPSESAAAVSTTPPGMRPVTSEAEQSFIAELRRPAPAREAALPEIPLALGPGDAVRAFARLVEARYTGAVAFEDASGIRRVLFRDGDFVTAASGVERESLVEFLGQRGDLPEETALRIARKLPQFGRHAGAALIAQGHLRQDDLWPVLRAHAEWLVARILLQTQGAVSLEPTAPARLQAEPAVFGGATGAEVLVEIVRRAIAPEEALKRLGGASALLQKGPSQALLSECAIADSEAELVRSISEDTVSEVLRRVGNKGFSAVLYALVELSVLAVASDGQRATRSTDRAPKKPDHLDHAAVRARILSRRALSDEGDYFALLGVSRNATSYDIRRAYLSLKEEFDPSRILTGDTVDLRDAVELILEVLAEAHEILEDDLRRDRYRRALDASP